MMRIMVLLMVPLALAACGERSYNYHEFDGVNYTQRSKGVERRGDAAFLVEISPVAGGLSGARQAGRYEATKYCIRYLGTSDIRWTVGPDDADEALRIEGDTLMLSGTCVEP